MTAQSTYSDLDRELDHLKAGLMEAETALLSATRQAVYDLIDSTLNRKLTTNAVNRRSSYLANSSLFDLERSRILDSSFGMLDQRIREALEQCRRLLSAMDVAEIVNYLDECHELGLELANYRCSERIAKRRTEALVTHSRRKAELISIHRRVKATAVMEEKKGDTQTS